MRYFIDTEFLEDGETIDLISIGIVAEDGREYYAISAEFDRERANRSPFLVEHVLPNLVPCMNTDVKLRNEIAADIRQFCGANPIFWADYGAYDWVAFCQLFGPMISLPVGYPMFCRDIQQLKALLLVESFPKELKTGIAHNALDDARECRNRYEYLAPIWRSFTPFYRP